MVQRDKQQNKHLDSNSVITGTVDEQENDQ